MYPQVLGISGSPIKKRNTDRLVQAVLDSSGLKAEFVKFSKITADGAEITLDIRKAGDFLGENMLSEQMNYPVTAWCMEDTLFCGFSKEIFEQLVLEIPMPACR